jgi:hypothetical protein
MADVLLSEGRKVLTIGPDGEGGLLVGKATLAPIRRKGKPSPKVEIPFAPGIAPPDGRSFVDGLTDDERSANAAIRRAFAVGARNRWTGR